MADTSDDLSTFLQEIGLEKIQYELTDIGVRSTKDLTKFTEAEVNDVATDVLSLSTASRLKFTLAVRKLRTGTDVIEQRKKRSTSILRLLQTDNEPPARKSRATSLIRTRSSPDIVGSDASEFRFPPASRNARAGRGGHNKQYKLRAYSDTGDSSDADAIHSAPLKPRPRRLSYTAEDVHRRVKTRHKRASLVAASPRRQLESQKLRSKESSKLRPRNSPKHRPRESPKHQPRESPKLRSREPPKLVAVDHRLPPNRRRRSRRAGSRLRSRSVPRDSDLAVMPDFQLPSQLDLPRRPQPWPGLDTTSTSPQKHPSDRSRSAMSYRQTSFPAVAPKAPFKRLQRAVTSPHPISPKTSSEEKKDEQGDESDAKAAQMARTQRKNEIQELLDAFPDFHHPIHEVTSKTPQFASMRLSESAVSRRSTNNSSDINLATGKIGKVVHGSLRGLKRGVQVEAKISPRKGLPKFLSDRDEEGHLKRVSEEFDSVADDTDHARPPAGSEKSHLKKHFWQTRARSKSDPDAPASDGCETSQKGRDHTKKTERNDIPPKDSKTKGSHVLRVVEMDEESLDREIEEYGAFYHAKRSTSGYMPRSLRQVAGVTPLTARRRKESRQQSDDPEAAKLENKVKELKKQRKQAASEENFQRCVDLSSEITKLETKINTRKNRAPKRDPEIFQLEAKVKHLNDERTIAAEMEDYQKCIEIKNEVTRLQERIEKLKKLGPSSKKDPRILDCEEQIEALKKDRETASDAEEYERCVEINREIYELKLQIYALKNPDEVVQKTQRQVSHKRKGTGLPAMVPRDGDEYEGDGGGAEQNHEGSQGEVAPPEEKTQGEQNLTEALAGRLCTNFYDQQNAHSSKQMSHIVSLQRTSKTVITCIYIWKDKHGNSEEAKNQFYFSNDLGSWEVVKIAKPLLPTTKSFHWDEDSDASASKQSDPELSNQGSGGQKQALKLHVRTKKPPQKKGIKLRAVSRGK